jgi:hypothetical protein
LSEFSISPEKHPEFKEKLLETARARVAEFPKQLALAKEQLRDSDALGIMACVASYGLQGYVSDKGIEQPRRGSLSIEQHHAELLQAILLSIPADEVSKGILTQDAMQTVFDTLPKLAETFFFQRIIDAEKIEDEAEQLVRSLQERVRLHTQAVRNWGYFEEVVRLTQDLFQPLNADLAAHHGFGATDLIETMFAVVQEYERRQSEHFSTLKKISRGGTVRQMLKLYYRHVPDLKGTPEELLGSLPAGITPQQLMALIIAHSDLRRSELMQFTPDELATITSKPLEVVRSILKGLSLPLGALADAKPEHFFLGNPVWETPLVDLGDTYFIPLPQIVFSHIHRVMDRLASSAKIKEKLSSRRSRFLEDLVEGVFRRVFPDAEVRSTVKWRLGDQQFETDLLVLIDRTIVIVEAKSHRLTAEGLRGAPDRVKRHIEDMVLEPSVQSARLQQLIAKAQMGDVEALKIMEGLKVDTSVVDRVVRISVTLDDLSVLSSAEPDFKKAGWVPGDHELAPTILIADLLCIAEILDNPLLFLHYLSERSYLQRSLNLMGDELDFLGLYLATGFNSNVLREKNLFLLDGMSRPIDKYFMSREAGVNLPKPKAELRPLFRQIINRLIETKPPGWTTIGLHLLSCADPAEQAAIERALNKLRKMVQKNHRDPEHLSSLQIHPPEQRKARVIFHLFPESRRGEMKKAMEHFAAMALERNSVDTCVVFARCTEAWGRAFEAVLLMQRDESADLP